MSKKDLLVNLLYLILSVIVTYGLALIFFGTGGVPFKFASFGFLGGSTNQWALLFNIAFWFIIFRLIIFFLSKMSNKK